MRHVDLVPVGMLGGGILGGALFKVLGGGILGGAFFEGLGAVFGSLGVVGAVFGSLAGGALGIWVERRRGVRRR